MTRRNALAAYAASLGLLLAAATLATDAFAGGGKNAPPPKPVVTEKYGSLADLEAACEEAEDAAGKEMRKKRYEKLVGYLASNATAKDAERAIGAAMDLA